ncbi:MAG TPA: hypothetical protein VF329_05770 [Gammaproteobacteria bacterium]
MHAQITPIRAALIAAGFAAMPAVTAYAQISDDIRGEPSEANHFIGTPEGWEHPMTPWGDPDIQATLDMMQASRVPLERCADSYRPNAPPCDLDQKWVPEEEYNRRMEEYRNRVDRTAEALARGDLSTAFRGGQPNRIPQRQTNLLVDPPNGLLPPLTPEGKLRAYEMGSDWALPGEDITFESVENFDSWDRCVTRGMPSMMMPYRYNGGFRIWQTPNYVVFQTEMIHEARIIPIDGRAPLDPAIKQWLGESRGHWEGTTFVVETTNYRDGMAVNNPMINLAVQGSPPGNRFPASDQMKTTERIIRLNDDTWLYEITTEDPVILTEPFTVRYPMRHDPDYVFPEYACHEGNTIVRNYIETNRYERAHPTPEPEQPPVEVAADVADALAGRWVGRPRIVTIDLDIELEFTKNADGTVNGKLIGTTLGEIDKPLRDFSIDGRKLEFTFPNVDPWSATVTLTEDGTLEGGIYSIQGTMPVTFKRIDAAGS